ncbi:MAG: CPBP family intramembrane glutamic endopeptidase [Bacteroidales bacterium]
MTKSILWPFSRQNQLYSETSSKEIPHGGITFLALVGILVFTLISTAIIVIITKAAGIELPQLISGLLQFIFFILAVWFYTSTVEKRSFHSLGFFNNRRLKNYLRGLLIGISLITISFVIISFVTTTNIVFSFNFNISSILSILSVLAFFLIQGASEEIVFRGWFLQSVAVRHWPWLGIVLSTFLFALVHMANPNFNLIAGVNILLIGFLLALLALYDGSLWSVCGFHSAWNFSMNSIFGINVSGNKLIGETLMETNFEGNHLITGGDFGLEGSIVVTIMIVLISILVIFLKKMD